MRKRTLKKKVIALLVVVFAVVIYLVIRLKTPVPIVTTKLLGNANYLCVNKKSISAAYYDADQAGEVSKNGQPVLHGKVILSLSEGRSVTLHQTISASGARYADANERIVFFNKGAGIIFTENGQESYEGCLEVAKDPSNLLEVYGNGKNGMTIRYPNGYTVDEAYTYQAFGPGKNIHGVKFTIPSSMATGTNLSSDTYISIEQATSSNTCSADLFLDPTFGGKSVTVVENGVTMLLASSTGAAAGNRYEEKIYAFPGSNPCLAIRYYVHYGTIGNYPKETKEFDKAALLKEFDAIRKTFIAVQ